MTETMEIYVKTTSNCEGLPFQSFERLSPEWTGESLRLPFGEDEIRTLDVVGWTDLYTGRPCPVHVARVLWLPQATEAARQTMGGPTEAQEGYLVWGGNSGLRILDEETEPTPGVDDHLPTGYGRPIVWVALADVSDLPLEVRDVVTRAICEGCGETLPLSASPYWLDVGRATWLCEACAAADHPDVKLDTEIATRITALADTAPGSAERLALHGEIETLAQSGESTFCKCLQLLHQVPGDRLGQVEARMRAIMAED